MERKAESAVRGENEAQKKQSEAEADMRWHEMMRWLPAPSQQAFVREEMEVDREIRKWDQKTLEMALRLIENLNLNGYNYIKRSCGLTLLRERIDLWELEMRNRLFLESRTKDSQEIEELR